MKRSTFFSFLSIYIALTSFCLIGCDEGDVKDASGDYQTTVTRPNGTSAGGVTTVTNSGDFFTMIINSPAGNFAFGGNLVNDKIETTFTDSSGSMATAIIQFSSDRSTFSGTIQTSLGLFVVRGMHL